MKRSASIVATAHFLLAFDLTSIAPARFLFLFLLLNYYYCNGQSLAHHRCSRRSSLSLWWRCGRRACRAGSSAAGLAPGVRWQLRMQGGDAFPVGVLEFLERTAGFEFEHGIEFGKVQFHDRTLRTPAKRFEDRSSSVPRRDHGDGTDAGRVYGNHDQ